MVLGIQRVTKGEVTVISNSISFISHKEKMADFCTSTQNKLTRGKKKN